MEQRRLDTRSTHTPTAHPSHPLLAHHGCVAPGGGEAWRSSGASRRGIVSTTAVFGRASWRRIEQYCHKPEDIQTSRRRIGLGMVQRPARSEAEQISWQPDGRRRPTIAGAKNWQKHRGGKRKQEVKIAPEMHGKGGSRAMPKNPPPSAAIPILRFPHPSTLAAPHSMACCGVVPAVISVGVSPPNLLETFHAGRQVGPGCPACTWPETKNGRSQKGGSAQTVPSNAIPARR